MTAPSERDTVLDAREAAYEKWLASFGSLDKRPSRFLTNPPFEAGWDAALEAQHTRDEEARALSRADFFDLSTAVRAYFGREPTAENRVVTTSERRSFELISTLRAYVQQSDRRRMGE